MRQCCHRRPLRAKSFFSKRCYVKDNTSWLCMLETSVLRKLLEDNEAKQLHWFRKKMDLNKRIVKFYVKFCGWKIGILERCLRNILLSIIAILGNTLILVAMRRESLERPSKLLCDERFSANWTFAGNATITGKIVR